MLLIKGLSKVFGVKYFPIRPRGFRKFIFVLSSHKPESSVASFSDQDEMKKLYEGPCFISNIVLFCQAVSEKKINLCNRTPESWSIYFCQIFVISGRSGKILEKSLHSCFLSNSVTVGKAVTEKKMSYVSANHKHESSIMAMVTFQMGSNGKILSRTYGCFL